jgi:hypothetical protein
MESKQNSVSFFQLPKEISSYDKYSHATVLRSIQNYIASNPNNLRKHKEPIAIALNKVSNGNERYLEYIKSYLSGREFDDNENRIEPPLNTVYWSFFLGTSGMILSMGLVFLPNISKDTTELIIALGTLASFVLPFFIVHALNAIIARVELCMTLRTLDTVETLEKQIEGNEVSISQ